MTKVHLCCGDVYLKDYINVDTYGDLVHLVPENINETTLDKYYTKELYDYRRPIVDRLMQLPEQWDYEANTVDEFLMICGLEHFPHKDALTLIERINDSLKPGGVFRFDFPNIIETVNRYKFTDPELMMRLIYGSGKNYYAYHKWGYTKSSIEGALNNSRPWSEIIFEETIAHEYPMIGVKAVK